MKKSYDIFCKIVDNFGDIGVCWRLARQLQAEHGLQVRLWIDSLIIAQHIIPALDTAAPEQTIEAVHIRHWHPQADFDTAADVVIETFACELPSAYVVAMSQKKSKWVNLEYLSAEPWVSDFHGRPSPQPQHGLIRYFYFPGFTKATGGLLRESALLSNKLPLKQAKSIQNAFWQSLNVFPVPTFKVSLFCYPHAPITALLNAMASSEQVTHCFVPATSILSKVAAYFGVDTLQVGDIHQQGSLRLQVLPFLSQQDYDQLLVSCDVNFVRGEDSWVRAIWAAKPFIWQPYWQEENSHMQKLDAFIDLFYQHTTSDVLQVVRQSHHAWVQDHQDPFDWQAYLAQLQVVQKATAHARSMLKKQTDLAAKLVIFCNKI